MVLFKKCRKGEKIQAELQFIYLFITPLFFFNNQKEIQNKFLPMSIRTVCVDIAVMFFCSRLIFKLFLLRIFVAVPVSSTSFHRLCCLDACLPGMDKGANSGNGIFSSVCVCVCVYNSREESGRPDGVFSHALGRFIHPSLR